MEKKMKGLTVGLMVGLMTFTVSLAFARSINLKEAGTVLWVFVIGAIIVLLQLIPAAILFCNIIGTATTMVFKKEKKFEVERVIPLVEPVLIKK